MSRGLDLIGNAGMPIQAEARLVSEKAKRLFSARDLQRIMRLAGFKAGRVWIEDWMVKRWQPTYAKKLFTDGKRVGGKDGIPFYEQGGWIAAAAGAMPRVTYTGTKGLKLTITVPAGHPLQPRTVAAFRSISVAEANAIARAFAAEAAQAMNAGVSAGMTRAKSLRLALPMEWRRDADALKITKTSGIGGEISARGEVIGHELKGKHDQAMVRRAQNYKRTLDKWRQSAFGSTYKDYEYSDAQGVSKAKVSSTYAGSRKQRHAQAQARYRQRNDERRAERQQFAAHRISFLTATPSRI